MSYSNCVASADVPPGRVSEATLVGRCSRRMKVHQNLAHAIGRASLVGPAVDEGHLTYACRRCRMKNCPTRVAVLCKVELDP